MHLQHKCGKNIPSGDVLGSGGAPPDLAALPRSSSAQNYPPEHPQSTGKQIYSPY